MLTKLINKFEQADGRSEFVIAVVADIRNFSAFSKAHEAPDTAMFIKKFYAILLKNYFTDAVYAKPTGDGLLMIFKYSEKSLKQVSEHVIANCLKAVADFPSMLSNDQMLNYEIPNRVGFGVARGTATCLYAGKEIIDYSGQVLNLASRLNDMARPKGVVIDGAFMAGTIPEKLLPQFKKTENIFIRGIHEAIPTSIFSSADVAISDSATHPIVLENWEKIEKTMSYSAFKKLTSDTLSYKLPKESLSPNKIKATLTWPLKGLKNHISTIDLATHEYMNDANGPNVRLSVSEMVKILTPKKLSGTASIKFIIQFVPKN